jgi:hypothetical protein
MPNKRSSRKKIHKFYCPKCETRLWRIGGPKYTLFCQGITEIQKGFNLSHKKASLLSIQEFSPINRNTWLEEFFCSKHGKIWMRITKLPNGLLTCFEATDKDWNRTTCTVDPNIPNSSVSEYTYYHSRRNCSRKYHEPI